VTFSYFLLIKIAQILENHILVHRQELIQFMCQENKLSLQSKEMLKKSQKIMERKITIFLFKLL